MRTREALCKPILTAREAAAIVKDGDIVMVGGFGGAGFPFRLRDALSERGLRDLTIISNNADFGTLANGDCIKQIYTSFPVGPTSEPVLQRIEKGNIKLNLIPQGTLIEQIRAGGAGLGGVLTRTGIGSDFKQDFDLYSAKDGKDYFIAPALRADISLIAGTRVDRYGNVFSKGTSLNFNLIMAMAGRITIVEAGDIVEPGELTPESIHIPGAFISYIVSADGPI